MGLSSIHPGPASDRGLRASSRSRQGRTKSMQEKGHEMTDSSTAPTAVLAQGTYHLDPTRSQVRYTSRHMFGMGTVHANFTIRGGELRICEPTAASSATVTVDAASFSSANAKRDKDVRSADLLDVARYPDITFASDELQQAGDALLVPGT